MIPIYYVQIEDKNISEGNSSNTLAGLNHYFKGTKEVLVFSNHADDIKDKYALSGMKTTIYQNKNFSLIDYRCVINTLTKLINSNEKYLIVFDNSNLGNSMGCRLAALLDTPFVSDVKNICWRQDHITIDQNIEKTQVFRRIDLNKGIISLSCNGVMDHGEAAVTITDWKYEGTTVAKYIHEDNSANDLAYAKVIVAGGKGLGSSNKFKSLAILSNKLNASLAATKAVTDQGWVDKKHMIGISNLSVAPDVYYAFGISGAVQHTAGMNKSRCVVAVNTDESAPIFKLADYGIIGDANIVIKQLNELL